MQRREQTPILGQDAFCGASDIHAFLHGQELAHPSAGLLPLGRCDRSFHRTVD